MSIINYLKIEHYSYSMIESDFTDRLNNLSKINIFVGANNSGKSRFMRSIFFNGSKLKFLPNDELFEYYVSQSNKFKLDENKPSPYGHREKREAYGQIEKILKEIEYIKESETPLQDLIDLYNMHKSNRYLKISPVYNEYFNEYFEELEFNKELFNYNFHKIYIPSLRSLIPLVSKQHLNADYENYDFYAERIKQDYFDNNENILTDISEFLSTYTHKSSNAIITGMQFYEYVKNYLLGDLEQRNMIRDYENYLSETFFDNDDVVIIPKVNDDVLTVKIGKEEYKIYELGDGIQSIILITLPLFLYLNKSYEKNTNVLVFIEEPEVGLHPRLQRVLIETLLDERFENYQFFFTTHSNHFIDKILEEEDISIYLFEKIPSNNSIPKFNIKNVDSNVSSALEQLGALPSSLLLNNCTIIVEGSHDIPHYENYLRLYQNYLKEKYPNSKRYITEVHYKFLRGGGKNTLKKTIQELKDGEKERTFLILDFDNEKEKEKYESAFERWKYDNFEILDVIEVENLISKETLLKILNDMPEIRELGINEDFNEQDYQKMDFYEFLIENILMDEFPDNFFTKDTLKKRFAKKEKNFLNSFNELSEPAKDISKMLYDFIDKNNN